MCYTVSWQPKSMHSSSQSAVYFFSPKIFFFQQNDLPALRAGVSKVQDTVSDTAVKLLSD